MRVYDSLCILDPKYTDEESSLWIEKFKEMLEGLGASIVKLENNGKKKLAYDIQHEPKGTYLSCQFQAEGKVIGALEHFYRMDDAVLKFMTLRVPHDQLPVQEPVEQEPVEEVEQGGRV